MASSSVITRLIGTVVNVDATIVVRPAVDADTVEAAESVDTSAAVLTWV